MFLFFFFQAEDGIRDWRDWSSDVCSSDLRVAGRAGGAGRPSAGAAGGGKGAWGTGGDEPALDGHARGCPPDRKSVVEGKSVDFGGRRILKKKKYASHP